MIQSDLLYLTPLTKDDFDLFVEIYTDPQLMEHVGPAFNLKATKELFNNCVNQIANEEPKYLFYVIKNKVNHEKLGLIGLLWNQPEKTSVELGVMIAKTYTSKGYAYKSLCLLMRYTFIEMNLQSIVLLSSINNSAVNRGVPMLGFQNISLSDESISNKGLIKWKITLQRYNKIMRK